MGLLYIFPVSTKEKDRVLVIPQGIMLKSYGLPKIFWIYFFCILSIISLMSMAIKEPLIKLFNTNDFLNQTLVILVTISLGAIPLVLLILFLYEKVIIKNGHSITVKHCVLGLAFKQQVYHLSNSPFEIRQFQASPNIAKMKNDKSMRAFQNQGYFELFIITKNGKKVLLDRNNKYNDLIRIADLLKTY